MNKKDLKKMMYSFNTISSRMMRVKWDEYNMVLKKFINFIDNNEIILDYINSGYDSNFDAEKEYNQVTTSYGDIKFNFGPTTEMESYQIYKILKHILEIDSKVHLAMIEQYNVKKFQECIKEFNDRVLLVLITNIESCIKNIIDELKVNNCITKDSKIYINNQMSIYLTLEGINYFKG